MDKRSSPFLHTVHAAILCKMALQHFHPLVSVRLSAFIPRRFPYIRKHNNPQIKWTTKHELYQHSDSVAIIKMKLWRSRVRYIFSTSGTVKSEKLDKRTQTDNQRQICRKRGRSPSNGGKARQRNQLSVSLSNPPDKRVRTDKRGCFALFLNISPLRRRQIRRFSRGEKYT